jgi:hypothetical protein
MEVRKEVSKEYEVAIDEMAVLENANSNIPEN